MRAREALKTRIQSCATIWHESVSLQCVLHCVAVRRSVLQCVEDADPELCNNLTCVSFYSLRVAEVLKARIQSCVTRVCMGCSVLQCVAVHCSCRALQRVAVCCSVLQRVAVC